MMTYQIAIDGPSGAGKSTVAMAVADRLGIDYIDTGSMYRAIALAMQESDKDLAALLESIDIDFKDGEVLLNGKKINDKIRNEKIAKAASGVSAIEAVRTKLVSIQRELGSKKDVILDGRDIASNVFPEAKYKFYLTASKEERAKRRWNDLKLKDPSICYDEVFEDIKSRDYNDMHRKLNPLVKVEDAIEVDTTGNTVEESAELVLSYIDRIGD